MADQGDPAKRAEAAARGRDALAKFKNKKKKKNKKPKNTSNVCCVLPPPSLCAARCFLVLWSLLCAAKASTDASRRVRSGCAKRPCMGASTCHYLAGFNFSSSPLPQTRKGTFLHPPFSGCLTVRACGRALVGIRDHALHLHMHT